MTVHVGLQGLAVNVAVTPAGRVDVENDTWAVVPLIRVAVIDDEELVPP